MKLNTNSNVYTLVYASVLVIFAAFLLAFVASALKSKQDENIANDKRGQILAALNIRNTANVVEAYKQNIVAAPVLNVKGEVVDTAGGFDVESKDITAKDDNAKRLPLYVAKVNNDTIYVVPLYGRGLWGGISGYLALKRISKPFMVPISLTRVKQPVSVRASWKRNSSKKFVGQEGVYRQHLQPRRTRAQQKDRRSRTPSGRHHRRYAHEQWGDRHVCHQPAAVQALFLGSSSITPKDDNTMSLFSKRNKEVLTGPLNLDNPIVAQVLGICSALAVTSQLKPAIVMGLSVTVITAFSNVIISLIRNTIPSRIRIIVQLVVVAALVTVVSQILKAYAYDVSVQLSVYVGLIITNCILMGRLEAFAMMNGPWESFLDGIGNGLGYAWILVVVGFVRELLGSGSLFGVTIPGLEDNAFFHNGMMTMPAMALIICGCVVWAHRAINDRRKQ